MQGVTEESATPLLRWGELRLDWLEAIAKSEGAALETIEVLGVKRQVRAEDADLSGSSFDDVNLTGATFNNVNFADARFEDANLSGWDVKNANLAGLRVEQADLRGVRISGCLTAGMTVDGIAVEEMIAAYRALTATVAEG